jgi:hypothetical protein
MGTTFQPCAHGDKAAAICHEGRGGAAGGSEEEGADIVRDAEGLTAGIDDSPSERPWARRRSEAQMELRFLTDGGEDAGDVFVSGDVAGCGVGSKVPAVPQRVFFEAFTW